MCGLITWTYCLVLEHFPRLFSLLANHLKQQDFVLLLDVWKSMTSLCLQVIYQRNTVSLAHIKLIVDVVQGSLWVTKS